MIRTLIRKKVLYGYRFLDRYFVIAMDGTGRLTFPERYCPHCLTATHHGKTTYYHPVLEAKLVFPNGFAFSVMPDFFCSAVALPLVPVRAPPSNLAPIHCADQLC
jgi:hypothetical protein